MGQHDPADAVEWQALFEALPHIVWVTRPDGWHVHFSQRWLDFTGRTLEESLGHGWNPAFHPDDRARAAARWEQATRTGEPYEIEYRLRRHDGVYRWMLGRALPVRDDAGEIVRWVGTCTDIEEIKQTRAELQQVQRLQQIAGATARVGGWTIDVATNTVYWSPMMYVIYEQPEHLDLDLEAAKDRYLPASRIELDAALDACISDGEPFDLELQLLTYRDRVRWVRAIGEAGRDGPDGRVTHLYGALQDITERKEAALANEELAKRLSVTLDSITDGFFTLDHEWHFTYLNGVAIDLLQRERDELLGANMWEKFPEALDTEAEEAYLRAARERVPITLHEYHFPPLGMWLEINIFPSEEGLTVSFRDITERRADQIALQERMKEARALAMISRDATALTDSHELATATAHRLRDAMRQPDDVHVAITLGEANAHAGQPAGALPEPLKVPIVAEGEARGEITVHSQSEPPLVRDEEALIVTAAETLSLWKERRRATRALEETNARLAEANIALEAAAQLKDDLLSMVSHELRTPLTPIIGFLELLEVRGQHLSSAERHEMIQTMRAHARRMLRLVEDLLISSQAMAHVLATRPETVDVAESISTVLEEFSASHTIADVTLDVAGCELFVDPHHLQQIVYNLLSNAAKYGKPPVEVRAAGTIDGRVAIEVADHGPGVADDFRGYMWDRFEQHDRGTTRTSRGAGLGLAIVKLLAEANQGRVEYRDGDPQGAVFVVELPGQMS